MDFIENVRGLHIGKIIEEKLKEKSMTVTELANRINRERTTVYDIFKRETLDIVLLIEISKALDYDFISNIYFKEKTLPTIFISIKTEEELLEKLTLLEEYLCFMKNKE